MWSLESGLTRTTPLDAHIEALVTFLEAKQEAIVEIRNRCVIDIFCGLFSADGAQGGLTIEPTLSARLAALDLSVGVDVY